MTPRDFEYLAFGLEHGVDYVALSFVRSAEDVERAKAFIAERGKRVPIIAKIEKHEALVELDSIIAAADGIMVARGDLGIEVPIETVPHHSKNDHRQMQSREQTGGDRHADARIHDRRRRARRAPKRPTWPTRFSTAPMR